MQADNRVCRLNNSLVGELGAQCNGQTFCQFADLIQGGRQVILNEYDLEKVALI